MIIFFKLKFMKPEIRVRLALIDILQEVLEQQHSLTLVLPNYLKEFSDQRDQALVQFCAYGICRDYLRLDAVIKKLTTRPIKDQQIYYLLLMGIYQIMSSRIPDFAVVNTTVEAAKALKLTFAAGFINGVLREFLRKKNDLTKELDDNPITKWSHPLWLIDYLKSSWPTQWEEICTANNQMPPMWLRINQQQIDSTVYLELLQKNNLPVTYHSGVTCCLQDPIEVESLPGFSQGHISVQDAAAQFAAELLDLQANQLILDACAAPGGKTCHILEKMPNVAKVIALDKDAERVTRIQDNLSRLKLKAEIVIADAAKPAAWWDKQLFDRILLDAPCSATGVIRRHPDIKILRHAKDIPLFVEQQLQLINALWPLLKPNGKLLYATCSILPQENEMVIASFCKHNDVQALPIKLPHGMPTAHGWQLIPGTNNMDGFFYALLQKTPL